MNDPQRVAIIGAGWSGITAALTLAQAPREISLTLFEANTIPGGRARRVVTHQNIWDNGQHVLISTYARVRHLLASVARHMETSCHAIPLQWLIEGGVQCCPINPASWMGQIWPGLCTIHRLGIQERWVLLKQCLGLLMFRSRHIKKSPRTVFQELHPSSSARLWQEFWLPLCWATLNTEPERAQITHLAEVFRHSFGRPWQSIQILIPQVDLSALYPEPAIDILRREGGTIHLGRRIHSVRCEGQHVVLDGTHTFDHVIIATAPWHVPKIWEDVSTARCLGHIESRPIGTVFARFPESIRTHHPNVMLGQRAGSGKAWDWSIRRDDHTIAWVKSGDSICADQIDWTDLGLPTPEYHQSLTEKRATFACTYERSIPQKVHAEGKIILAGDYLHPTLPSTLEAAVATGETSAHCLLDVLRTKA